VAAKHLLAIRIFVAETISASWLPFGHGKGIELLLAVDDVSLRETSCFYVLATVATKNNEVVHRNNASNSDTQIESHAVFPKKQRVIAENDSAR